MEAELAFGAVRSVSGAVIIIAGMVFIAGGSVGLLRFPDVYTRLHAASAANGPGSVIVVAGLALLADDWGVALRLALLAVLMGAAAPVLTHFTASAAHAAGITPLTGSYAAPRPGRKEASP